MTTLYQRWGVQHAAGANQPDYPELYAAGFRTVTFQPEDPRASQFICNAHAHGLNAGFWFADPGSAGVLTRGDPEGFADDVVAIVRGGDAYTSGSWTARSQLVYLDIEFTGKGYPTWRAQTAVKAWHRWEIDGHEWQTFADGATGANKPTFAPGLGATAADGSVTWHWLGPAAYQGWDWNERMMARLRRPVADGGMPGRPVIVQPMGHQSDFNYGAYLKQRPYGKILTPPARVSPQCYDGSLNPFNVENCVQEIADNGYCVSHYGFAVDRRYIHPSLAPGRSADYDLSGLGPRGYTIFRADYMLPSDFTAYAPYMLP